MKRWLVLLVIGVFVGAGLQGCVLVVADEDVAQEIREDRNRSRIARDLQKSIDRNEMFNYSDISVSEDNGVVTLEGDVDSLEALNSVIGVVNRYPGVDSLRLRLDVITHNTTN